MTDLPPIESVLARVKRRTLRVNHMGHRSDGQWQAGLRSGDGRTYFANGYGPDPQGALEAALEKAMAGKVTTQVVDQEAPAGPIGEIVEEEDLIG